MYTIIKQQHLDLKTFLKEINKVVQKLTTYKVAYKDDFNLHTSKEDPT